MGATKLGVFNDALGMIGERNLVSVTEDVEARYALDGAWDKAAVSYGGPIYCLELGYWNHATRSAAINYSPSVEPPFGFLRAFDKPVDWVRTVSVAADPYYDCPMTQYSDESDFWFADLDVLYVKYVSKDMSYGLDMSIWPMSFQDFVSLYLADQIVDRLTSSATKGESIHKQWKEAKSRANGIDGTNKPTQRIPTGSWAAARGGAWGFGRNTRREL
jgi:hypothetical protein